MKACRALPAAAAVALPPFSAVKFRQSISALSCFMDMDLHCAAHQTSLEGLGSSLVPKATVCSHSSNLLCQWLSSKDFPQSLVSHPSRTVADSV